MKSKKTIAPDLDEVIPHLISVWRRFHKLAGPPDKLQTREFRKVVEDVIKIYQAAPTEQDPFEDRDYLGAYLLYSWVLHYQEGLSLIQELPFLPSRVLDIASGPCAFAFAALRCGASDVTAIDRNMTALQLGADVCGRWGYPLTVRKWDFQSGKLPVEGKFDLIIIGYCLDELFPSDSIAKRYEFLKKLTHYLTPKGQILIVDSSVMEVNRAILRLRDYAVKEGFPVQAPCVWRGECPALAAQSLCFAQREMEKPYLIKEIQRAASINLSSLKMSYLILRNPESSFPSLPDRKLYRVISPPVETYHGKRFYLCGTDGGKRLESHLKEQPKQSRAFDYLRRGELLSFENALESDSTIEIVKDTSVIVEAACGKPLPTLNDS